MLLPITVSVMSAPLNLRNQISGEIPVWLKKQKLVSKSVSPMTNIGEVKMKREFSCSSSTWIRCRPRASSGTEHATTSVVMRSLLPSGRGTSAMLTKSGTFLRQTGENLTHPTGATSGDRRAAPRLSPPHRLILLATRPQTIVRLSRLLLVPACLWPCAPSLGLVAHPNVRS